MRRRAISIWLPCGVRPYRSRMLSGSFLKIKRIGRLRLHLEGHFVRLQPRLELRVFLQVLAVEFVELVHQIQLAPLLGQRRVRVVDVLDDLVNARSLGVDAHALVHARQKGRLPVGTAARRRAAGAQGNKPGHVLVFRSQTVKHPRPQARARKSASNRCS